MILTLSSVPKVARVTAVILAACGSLAFAQPAPAPVNPEQVGALVSSVDADGPAEKAGIARGDIILEVGGTPVNSYADLQKAIASKKPGDTVAVKIRHGDLQSTVSVTLAENKGKAYLGVSISLGGRDLSQRQLDRGSRGAVPLLPAPRQLPLLAGPGAVITKVVAGSPAEKAGLKKGDLIPSVDGTAVDAANSLSSLIASHKVGDTVTLSVRTGRQEPRDVKVTLGKHPDKDAPYLGIEYTMMNRMFSQDEVPWTGQGAFAGVLVASVVADGPAAKAGVKATDRITAIEAVPVQSPQAVSEAVAARKPGDRLSLTLYRPSEQKEISVEVTLGENPNDKTKGYLGISMSSFMAPGVHTWLWSVPDKAAPGAAEPQKAAPGI